MDENLIQHNCFLINQFNEAILVMARAMIPPLWGNRSYCKFRWAILQYSANFQDWTEISGKIRANEKVQGNPLMKIIRAGIQPPLLPKRPTTAGDEPLNEQERYTDTLFAGQDFSNTEMAHLVFESVFSGV
jgi:hypothetical protein